MPDTVYCVYTDRDIPPGQASSEHVIPLALGGVDGFEILVDRARNSDLGARIDGVLALDYFTALRRSKYDSRGHSGREPWAVAKRATYGSERRPAQVHVSRRHGIRLWDARERSYVERPDDFQFTVHMNLDLPLRFVAKTALSAGYFAYGERFRSSVDHRQLRAAMLADQSDRGNAEELLRSLTLHGDDRFRTPEPPAGSRIAILRQLCSAVNGSVVLLVPERGALVVAVGILGEYVGLLTTPADTSSFPNSGDYSWGHAIGIENGKLQRISFAELLENAGLDTPPTA